LNAEDGCQSRLGRYVGVVDRLEASVHDLGEMGLDLSLSPESWTIRQVVHHVVDGDDIWKINIKAALGRPERVLSVQWYWDVPQDAWAETWGYADRALSPSLDLLRASRRHIVQILGQLPGSLDRSATFRWPSGEVTRLTVGDLVAMQTDHVSHHTGDIRAIREMYGL
jgi:uncharacterized damage-inducible protein DinB